MALRRRPNELFKLFADMKITKIRDWINNNFGYSGPRFYILSRYLRHVLYNVKYTIIFDPNNIEAPHLPPAP